MAVRPNSTKKESIMSVADAVVWAVSNYGWIPHNTVTTRPVNTKVENIKSVNDVIAWLVTV